MRIFQFDKINAGSINPLKAPGHGRWVMIALKGIVKWAKCTSWEGTAAEYSIPRVRVPAMINFFPWTSPKSTSRTSTSSILKFLVTFVIISMSGFWHGIIKLWLITISVKYGRLEPGGGHWLPGFTSFEQTGQEFIPCLLYTSDAADDL